ncbi:MAG: cation transporter, partial [Pseudomonadales bacterium]|nr:cation transporter [Pseudomonadales bacterium]
MTTGAAAHGPGPRDLLFVDGMFCAACAATVEARLARLPGVESCAVDLGAGAAALRWAPGREDADAVRRLVERLGYRVRRADEAMEAGPSPKRDLELRLAVALFFGMWTMLPSIALYLDAAPNAIVAHGLAWAAGIASLPVLLWSGVPFYRMALRTLSAGAPGIDALVAIGVAGAVLLSAHALATGVADVFFEVAVALITLQLVARLVDLGVARAGREAVARLLELAPPRAQRLAPDGSSALVPVAEIEAGELVRVEAGDTLAVDGVVEAGDAEVDRSLLSGESTCIAVGAGAVLHAGEVLASGAVRLRVSAGAGERRIDALGRRARALLLGKAPWQAGVDRLARRFLLLSALAAG